MKYCTNCGVDISKRGNRALKCTPCQRQDIILLRTNFVIEGLGSQNTTNLNGKYHNCEKTFKNMLVCQHKYAILPEDNSDTRQNALETIRRKRGWRSREEVYEEWGWIY